MTEIIEKFIQSKDGSNDCGDGLFINDHYIAIIDGATGKGKITWHGKKSDAYSKNVLLNALSKLAVNASYEETIFYLNESLYKASQQHMDIVKKDIRERLRASIIIYSDSRKEIWSFGDCQCLVNQTLYFDEKKIDKLLSEVRSMVIQSALISGMEFSDIVSNDIGRKFIIPLLERQLLFENTQSDYGYPVLTGFNIDVSQTKVITVKAHDTIVLASDGYPRLELSLSDSERELSLLINNDPLFYREYKATKGMSSNFNSFDDRSYVKFIVL